MQVNCLQMRFGQKRGTVMVLTTFGLMACLGFASLSIDISHVYQQQRELQSATDAGALAAAALITNPPPADADIIQEAVNIASANGVTATEIAASNAGTIQVGQWDGTSFTASKKPYNAVRVPAKRTVPLWFGPVVGLRQKPTEVHSVAVYAEKSSSGGANGAGLIPFGFDISHIDELVGSTHTVNKANQGAGNFGQLDFSGGGNKNKDLWYDNMLNGCGCTYSVQDQIGTLNGDNGNCKHCSYSGLNDRRASNPYATVPIIGCWSCGPGGDAIIVGFMGIEMLSVDGPAGNWSLTYRVVSIDMGGGTGGGTTNTPYASRVLVQ